LRRTDDPPERRSAPAAPTVAACGVIELWVAAVFVFPGAALPGDAARAGPPDTVIPNTASAAAATAVIRRIGAKFLDLVRGVFIKRI
jgi:hypothetical protein